MSESHGRKYHLNLEEDPTWLYGRGEDTLGFIQELAGVRITSRGHQIHLVGEDARVLRVEAFIRKLEDLRRHGKMLNQGDIRVAAASFFEEGQQDLDRMFDNVVLVSSSKKQIAPKSPNQRRYIHAIRDNDIVFGIGSAGTGKTYLAVAMAVSSLLRKEVNRIILTRPAVEAGERLGFLPGDLYEKIHPYLRPLYDALYEMLEAEKVNKMVERGTIEIAPLAFMRGRTLNDSFIILDEAQNTTSEQMMMFLTRLGFDSKAVITGDVTQIDLPSGRQSGLVEAREVLRGIDGIAMVTFTEKDVVRHELVKKIIKAYEIRTASAAGRESQGGTPEEER